MVLVPCIFFLEDWLDFLPEGLFEFRCSRLTDGAATLAM